MAAHYVAKQCHENNKNKKSITVSWHGSRIPVNGHDKYNPEGKVGVHFGSHSPGGGQLVLVAVLPFGTSAPILERHLSILFSNTDVCPGENADNTKEFSTFDM